ncbi:MAG: 4-hydroxy-3-methylbut-2-enyl diphosphate reductase [Candidatus Saganbacteria bacterium]|nr:4-hydroxy-3-methylbut-2-enyl diphosphate reductase [Candidatus Saganbacteria bacterium]
MKIMIAAHSGFCEGVERAYRIALEQTKAGRPVFMLGNLVHNKQVVERLTALGVRTVAGLAEIPPGSRGVLLISAHGVAPEIYETAKQLGLDVIDTTCPWVKKAQQLASRLAAEGRLVVIVGDRGHPEVKSLLGWSGGRAVVVENEADVNKLSFPAGTRVGVVAQTTQATAHFERLVEAVKRRAADVVEFDTICGATTKRQSAATELARQVGLMLVIGDRLSANTKRLTELCAATGTETHQIQTVAEFDRRWLAGKQTVGVTAGASTPEWVIQEILAALRQ